VKKKKWQKYQIVMTWKNKMKLHWFSWKKWKKRKKEKRRPKQGESKRDFWGMKKELFQ